MTKRECFNEVAKLIEVAELTDEMRENLQKFVANELHLLDNRKGKSGKTKTQKLNEELVETVFSVLAEQKKPMSVTELLTSNPTELVNPETKMTMTGQKLSALLKKLVEADRVVRTVEKKVAKFSVAE